MERVEVIKWELAMLLQMRKELQLVGRDLGYYDAERIDVHRKELDLLTKESSDGSKTSDVS